MPRQLIQTLTVVFFTTSMLLALESQATAAADPLFAGDLAAVHTEAWASANQPDIPLPSKCDHSVDAGYHAPEALHAPGSAPAQPRSSYRARAPPTL